MLFMEINHGFSDYLFCNFAPSLYQVSMCLISDLVDSKADHPNRNS